MKPESKYLEEPPLDNEVKLVKKGKKKRITCKKIIESIYDKKEGTIFNRTPKDWAYLLIFFIIFYVFLFGYFTLLLFIFISGILRPNTPFRTGANSLIGAKSSLSFNPVIGTTSLIRVADPASRNAYLAQVDAYMRLNLPAENAGAILCNDTNNDPTPPPVTGHACQFNATLLGPCQFQNTTSLATGLCVFLRINNIYGWLPDITNSTFSTEILLHCGGKTAGDTAKLRSIDYYPSKSVGDTVYGSIKNFYYPFLNQSTYGPPIVAVHFHNLTKNTEIFVNCNIMNVKNANSLTTFSLFFE